MPTPQQLALQKFMSSPGIANSTANASGVNFTPPVPDEEYMVPGADSMEVRAYQAEGQPGASMSRQAIRESALAKVRGMLKMKQAEDQQAQQMAHIKGGYDVQGDVQGAQAAMDRVLAQQAGQTQRTQLQQDAAGERAQLQSATQQGIAGGNQAIQKQKVSSAAIRAINSQIAAMEKAASSKEPGALGKMFGRTNPMAAQVQNAKAARDLAITIARDYPPGTDVEEALQNEGVLDATPDEVGQVASFLGMLRGL